MPQKKSKKEIIQVLRKKEWKLFAENARLRLQISEAQKSLMELAGYLRPLLPNTAKFLVEVVEDLDVNRKNNPVDIQQLVDAGYCEQ